MESCLAGKCRKQRWIKMGRHLANKSGKKKANKSWQTLGNPFLEVLPKPSNFKITSLQTSAGKQSHKGGCPEEAPILFNETVWVAEN